MTTDLETRLQTMAGALRHAVPEAPPRRRPPGPGRVVVGAALVAVAAAGAFTAVRSNDDPVAVDPAQVASLRGLVAEELPDGLALSWAGQRSGRITADDGAVAGAGDAVSDLSAGPVELHTYLYGEASGASPFGSDDLVVNVWNRAEGLAPFDASQAVAGLEGAVESTVQGQAAVVCDLASCSGSGDVVNSVHWVTAQGQEVVVASRSLDVDQLRRIADGLVVEGTTVALGDLPPELAGKLVELGSLADKVVGGVRSVDAYWVGYSDGGAGTQAVDVTTSAGDLDDLMAAVWALGASVEQVEVRGQAAYVAETADGAVELVWQEGEGVIARVTAVGLGRDQVVGFVEKLRWVAEGEWSKVEELAAAAQAAVPTTVPTLPGSAGGNVSVDAGVSPDGADVDVQVDTPVGQLQATLHTDLGAEAVIGPLTAGAAALQDAGQQVADEIGSRVTTPTTLPFP